MLLNNHKKILTSNSDVKKQLYENFWNILKAKLSGLKSSFYKILYFVYNTVGNKIRLRNNGML